MRHVHGTTFYHKGPLTKDIPPAVHQLRIKKREGGEGTRLWVDSLDGSLGLVQIGPVRKRLAERSRLGRRAGDRLGQEHPAPLLDLVEVRIQDNGPGIPAAVLARVFDPFYTTRTQGTGLGLSICQTIIREHGGSISIESVVGQGTSVLIDLPVEKRHGDRRGHPR